MLSYPMGSLRMENMAGKVKYVQFLHDASEIRFSTGSGDDSSTISMQLPVLKPPVEIPVLEIILN
jgi:alpha-L-fucosidase